MRFVIAALALVALLAIWLTTHRDDAGPNEAPTGRAVTPVTMPRGPDLAANQEAFEPPIPDEIISGAEAIVDPVQANVFSDPTVQTPAIEFDPEQRIKMTPRGFPAAS